MSITRNSAYNLAGAVVPMVCALITIPLYLKYIGVERYGVLSIAWLLLGYFGVFDLGLSRATAHQIAAKHDASARERAEVFWTALIANTLMGVLGAIGLWLVASWYFKTQMNLSDVLRQEILISLPILCLSVPVATVSGVMLGALQGEQRFLELNVISTISTILLQVIPLLCAVFFRIDLTSLLLSSILARFVSLGAIGYLCLKGVASGARPNFNRSRLSGLLGYGGWVALTSLAAPLLVLTDRFLIGGIIGAAAVTVYTVPFQLAQRLSVIGTSLGNALFPRLSSTSGREQDTLAERATHTLSSLMTLPTLLAILLIDPFLDLWIGTDLSRQSAPIGKILLVGYWINSFAIVAYVQLQAKGRPDLVAKILFSEVPFYLCLLTVAIFRFGLIGASLVFTLRFAIDYCLLMTAAGHPFRKVIDLAPSLCLLLFATFSSMWVPLPTPGGWLLLLGLTPIGVMIGWAGAPADLRQRAIQLKRRVLIRE